MSETVRGFRIDELRARYWNVIWEAGRCATDDLAGCYGQMVDIASDLFTLLEKKPIE